MVSGVESYSLTPFINLSFIPLYLATTWIIIPGIEALSDTALKAILEAIIAIPA